MKTKNFNGILRFFAKTNSKGFTMVELMVVIVIMGLLATIVGVSITSAVKKARVNTARTQMKNFESALKLFKLNCGFYPSTEQGLMALIEKPTIGRECREYPVGDGFWDSKNIPDDPWSSPYQYASPGMHNTNGIDIWSFGEDAQEGTEDDIVNWVEQTQE